MAGFDRDNFWLKLLSMYDMAKENNFTLKVDEEGVAELKAIYIDLYIPMENLGYYDDEQIMKKMMTAIVSICELDKGNLGKYDSTLHLVNTVNYDGRNLYIKFAKISPVRMRRIQLGKTRQQIAERMGYGVSAVSNCEATFCDLSRQPEALVRKLAMALECEPEDLM